MRHPRRDPVAEGVDLVEPLIQPTQRNLLGISAVADNGDCIVGPHGTSQCCAVDPPSAGSTSRTTRRQRWSIDEASISNRA